MKTPIGIQFDTNPHEYTVHEFYRHYRDSFPQLAVVTQGYHGEIGIETFGRGQALRIFAYYTQKRVMASVYHEVGRTPLDKTLLSIPLDGDTKFHLTDTGTQDTNEYTLSQLLESGKEDGHTLPIDIQFADETQAKSVGLAFRELDKTLHIRIFEQFDEIFLLGNPLCDGCVYAKVVEIPVYLPTMKMGVATGIKGHDTETWRRYKSEMRDSIEKNTQVVAKYGRTDIAVYSTSVLHTYDSYTFLPPISYIKIGPDESNCTLSLSLECIFEPLFLTNEKKVLTKESNETRNEANVNGGQASNIIDEEKINVSQDGTDIEKQDIEDKNDESEEIKETKNEILGNNQKEQNVVKPRASIHEYAIEFDHLPEDMTVKEFYDRCKDHLPKVILITQGYHGETGIESFGRGQIIRIHNIFKQRRVKAELVHGHGADPEGYQISIPLDYKAKFFEVKHLDFHKPKERTLSEILKKHKITHHPEVKFAEIEESFILNLDPKLRKSFTNSHLKLLEEYEEIYLLGNPISEGCLFARVMSVPISLQDLKLSIISGIKGCSEESWEEYQAEMTETVNQNVNFDGSYGNENIAVYTKQKNTSVSYLTYLPPPDINCENPKTNDDGERKMTEKRLDTPFDDICLYKPHALLNRFNSVTDTTEEIESAKHDHSEKKSTNKSDNSVEAEQNNCGNAATSSLSMKVDTKQESNRNERFGIKFTHEEKEYSVLEFYDAHHSLFPLLVAVVQGHYGDIGMETLDIGQVIRVHSFCTQKRVVAKVKEGHKLLVGKLLSIPVDYPLEFNTFENDRTHSDKMFLRKILDSNQLPVDVKMDPSEPDTTCLIGQRIFRCRDVPIMTLIEHIEVFYLVGNPIADGCLYSRIVEIPVKLPDVKLSIVSGAVNTSEKAWLSYIQGLSDTVRDKIKFDGEYGHKDITFYTPDKSDDNKPIGSNVGLSDEDIFLETETSVEEQGKSHELLEEVLAAAYEKRPESVCLYEPHLLTLDMNFRKSKGQETTTDD